MKVSIGIELQSGPWGGGNQFGLALVQYLKDHDIEVVHNLMASDIDLILLIDPRLDSRTSSFTDYEVCRYLRERNPNAIVIHRVNDCDERKGTTYINTTRRRANACADHTVFVSGWLQKLHLAQGMRPAEHSVIHNGSDSRIFNPCGYYQWQSANPMRIVTHHWSAHWMKGFDIYQQFDALLAKAEYQKHFEFTYIGRLPDGFSFQNSRYIEAKHGEPLAVELKNHHVYLTASQYEPGGNHQNEGANCGLPLLYRNSGSMPEYCHGFGVEFTEENFEQKLWEMHKTYDHWVERMSNYPYTAEYMCEKYYNLFVSLVNRRHEIISNRKNRSLPPIPWWAYLPKSVQLFGLKTSRKLMK